MLLHPMGMMVHGIVVKKLICLLMVLTVPRYSNEEQPKEPINQQYAENRSFSVLLQIYRAYTRHLTIE